MEALMTETGGGMEIEKHLGGKKEVIGRMVSGCHWMLQTRFKKEWASK